MFPKKPFFENVDLKVNFCRFEERILDYWEEKNIFAKTQKKKKGQKNFVFFEGPPTANGKPHIGHVITRVFKDIFPRFKTMQGYFVLRKGGWDTHGLPVEVEVEKELGISSKEEIENIVKGKKEASIKRFNNLCKKNVWKYIDLWNKMVKRVGHWIDLKDPYVTYSNDYIESVWWSLKKLFDEGYLYKDYKVVPYCTRCGTPLSSHEVAQDYKEKEDNSIYVKFPFSKDTYFLVWTTTPWTLPGNVALAIDPKLTYIRVRDLTEGVFYILSRQAAKRLGFKTEGIELIKGSSLLGHSYSPVYDFLKDFKNKDLFKILPADFIDVKEGTGIVHTAVMYGEEDYELSKRFDLPKHHLVNNKGQFIEDAHIFSGKSIWEANPLIIEDLKERGLLFKEEKIVHDYPFCWRCHNPLVYYALESWFIKTTAFRKKLIENNNKTNWIPPYIKKGRMGNWYKTLIDWSISRNRYWGTPLPIWICEGCGLEMAIGSIKELKDKAISKKEIDWKNIDLHKPLIDKVFLRCPKCGAKAVRTPEVIDVWYDSGCMPFAQWHYPFENKELFKSQFPADFISEAIDQTRGWFFSLQAVSTMIFGKTPYKNVVVFEHALDPEGKKMSKHLGNVLNPWKAIDKYGADSVRWFFLSSVSIGTKYRVSVDTIGKSFRGFILPLWNVYNFFVTYANTRGFIPKMRVRLKPKNILDKWILVRLKDLIICVTENLENYDSYKAAKELEKFLLDDLSKWYIRRSRERLGPYSSLPSKELEESFSVFYYTLLNLVKLLAPFVPFVSEGIFRNLTKKESVHLERWPKVMPLEKNDRKILKEMEIVRELVSLIHNERKKVKIPVRQPLLEAIIFCPRKLHLQKFYQELIKEEVNVKKISLVFKKGKSFKVDLNTEITSELEEEGKVRQIIRMVQEERKKMGIKVSEEIELTVPWLPESNSLKELLKKRTFAKVVKIGDFKVKRSF